MQDRDVGEVVRKEESNLRRYLSRTAIAAVLLATIGTLTAGALYLANTPVRQPRKRAVQYDTWAEYYEDRIPQKIEKYGKQVKDALGSVEGSAESR